MNLDIIDDKVFELIDLINQGYKLGLNLDEVEHTPIIIDTRDAIITEIKEYVKFLN